MTPTPESKVAYHKRRIIRLVDRAAVTVIRQTGKAKLVKVDQMIDALPDNDLRDIIASAYLLAGLP